jgi:hypothetical protein
MPSTSSSAPRPSGVSSRPPPAAGRCSKQKSSCCPKPRTRSHACAAGLTRPCLCRFERSANCSLIDGVFAAASDCCAIPRAGSASEQVHQQQQSVELVWTGPDAGVVHLRRTEQALLQVFDSACRRATVVSYAVYNIPRICEALVRAADRGVSINVIIETPDRLAGKNTYNTLKALGRITRTGRRLKRPRGRQADRTSGSGGFVLPGCGPSKVEKHVAQSFSRVDKLRSVRSD